MVGTLRHLRDRSLLVLGLDPGPDENGWALVESIRRGGHPAFVAGGKVMSEGPALRWVLRRAEQQAAMDRRACPDLVVAIERPHWHGVARDEAAQRAIGACLIETNYVVGRIAEMAEARGLAVLEIAAPVWRKRVLGKATADDAAIAQALPLVVSNLPKRSNAHVRDACGVAVGALRALRVGLGAEGASRFEETRRMVGEAR